MKGHGGMVRRTSELIARVLRRRANAKTLCTRHLRFASRCRSVRQKPAASGLVDNKGKAPHVRSFFPLEVQVHSRRGAGVCVVEKVFFVLLERSCSTFRTRASARTRVRSFTTSPKNSRLGTKIIPCFQVREFLQPGLVAPIRAMPTWRHQETWTYDGCNPRSAR